MQPTSGRMVPVAIERNPLPDQIAVGHYMPDADGLGRIRGYVDHAKLRGWDPNLDVPVISHVEGNLWQGGCPERFRVMLPEGFRHVVSLYPWGDQMWMLPEGCTRSSYSLYDSLDQAMDAVDSIAGEVAAHAERHPTLVHCQAGLNRSGLVAARVLMMRGYTADGAIEKLRKGRSHLVLCNDAFENHLRSLDA